MSLSRSAGLATSFGSEVNMSLSVDEGMCLARRPVDRGFDVPDERLHDSLSEHSPYEEGWGGQWSHGGTALLTWSCVHPLSRPLTACCLQA